jgi:putative ABC transport system ATP-binding protein
MQNQIALRAVSHHFGQGDARIHLFNDIDLTLEGGNSYSIVGPSGVGKSSLLTLAAGLERPKSGQVQISLKGKSSSCQMLRKNSGFIFQQFHLLPELDAIGNVALPLRLKGDSQAHEKAAHWLEMVGLEGRAKHRPNQLSGGEQQRVAVARAFVSDPAFIFADEPTGNVDHHTSEAIGDLMFEFSSKKQCALVVVTHSESIATRATRQYSLNHGSLEQLQ